MARNLAQRLDRLERLAAELLNTNQGPVYLREGEAVPEGREPVYVKRVFLDPPDVPTEELPETTEPSPAIATIASLHATAGNPSAGDRLSEKPSSPHTGLLIHRRG